MSDVLLEANDVQKRYRNGATELQVLRGVSLNIHAGEYVCIVGPSGAGKSTLLHLLGGIDQPSDGEVRLHGQSWHSMTEAVRCQRRSRQVGFVFQSYHLFAELTVLENLILAGWVAGVTHGVRSHGQELLDLVGLADRASHRPAQLSGGEQQRVAVARALMNNPELLLCDEPTGNLDSASGARVRALLQKAQQEDGRTVVVVSHDPEFAGDAERVVHIRDGQLVEAG